MNTNSGTLQNTFNYLVPAAGTTRGYRVTKEFVPGQIEVCDFRNMSLDGVSFVPSGVLIDNTRGVDNCVVTILEYSWRIVIPAGQFAHMPYPAPYNQTATIEGNAPELTVVFVDYPVIPFFQNNSGGGSVGGITDINAGDGISIDKTNPSVPVISATGGGGGGGGDAGKMVILKTQIEVGAEDKKLQYVTHTYDPDNLFDPTLKTILVPENTSFVRIEYIVYSAFSSSTYETFLFELSNFGGRSVVKGALASDSEALGGILSGFCLWGGSQVPESLDLRITVPNMPIERLSLYCDLVINFY